MICCKQDDSIIIHIIFFSACIIFPHMNLRISQMLSIWHNPIWFVNYLVLDMEVYIDSHQYLDLFYLEIFDVSHTYQRIKIKGLFCHTDLNRILPDLRFFDPNILNLPDDILETGCNIFLISQCL